MAGMDSWSSGREEQDGGEDNEAVYITTKAKKRSSDDHESPAIEKLKQNLARRKLSEKWQI